MKCPICNAVNSDPKPRVKCTNCDYVFCEQDFEPEKDIKQEFFVCSGCDTEVSIDYKICPECGTEHDEDESAFDNEENHSKEKYTTGRGVIGFLLIFGWITVIIGGITVVKGFIDAVSHSRMGVFSIVGGFGTIFGGLLAITLHQIFLSILDMANNSSAIKYNTEEILKRLTKDNIKSSNN